MAILESIAAANAAKVRIVHSYVEEFDGVISPTGFAAMVLLDESHISAHCYYDKGWLAVDAFTCGGADPNGIADDLDEALRSTMDDLVLIRRDAFGSISVSFGECLSEGVEGWLRLEA